MTAHRAVAPQLCALRCHSYSSKPSKTISCRIPIENVARIPQVIWCTWEKAEEDDLPIWSVHLGGKTSLKTNNSIERMKTGIQEVEK